MRRPARARALLVVLTALGLALTACGSGPSQANSAAIVGEESVPLGDVQHEIQWMIDNVPQAKQAKQQRKLDNFARQAVSARVMHELISVAAQREKLRVNDSRVSDLINSSGGVQQASKAVGVAPERLRQVARDQLLIEELGRSYLDRLEVSFSGTVIADERPGSTAKDQAMALGRKIAGDPDRADQLIRQASGQQQQSTNQRMTLAQSLSAGGDGQLASSALFGTPANTVVVFQPSQQQAAWLVALVEERDTRANASASGAGQQASSQVLYQIGVRMLAPLANELGVRINPRYGVWDQVAMTISPNEDQLAGYELPVRDQPTAKP
ncbi:MAG: hypothetical protein GEU98_14350 [Pseudonocardiaceae bacterium]|nr:hypothetical protein [Pseudonocardiaceae bacterium]